MADLDSTLVERIKELAKAQVDADRIIATIVVEYQVSRAQLTVLFPHPDMVEVIERVDKLTSLDKMALAGQAELQARMWLVALDHCDSREGVQMSQWLAKNFLGHSGSDVSTEIKQLLAQLKADPAGAGDLLDKALKLVPKSEPEPKKGKGK